MGKPRTIVSRSFFLFPTRAGRAALWGDKEKEEEEGGRRRSNEKGSKRGSPESEGRETTISKNHIPCCSDGRRRTAKGEAGKEIVKRKGRGRTGEKKNTKRS